MKILITDGIAPEGAKLLLEAGFEIEEKFYSQEVLINEIARFDAVIVRSATKITKDIIDASNLKVIARGGVGLDNIDVEYAKSKDIKVVNTPLAASVSVAELVIGDMFALSRFLHKSTVAMKAGKWPKKEFAEGIELTGKTLGIIGFGAIGQQVAKRALGLSMNVIAFDKFSQSTMESVKRVEFDQLLANSDFITLHVPFDKKAGSLLTDKEFEKMKKGVILVNASRGGVVDEISLLNALNSGKVRCAAIDVFKNEPPTEEQTKLIAHENVLLSPHIGASTIEGQLRVSTEIAESVINNLKGI